MTHQFSKKFQITVQYSEVGAGAFFALSRSRARNQKWSAKARRKKSAKKSEFALFPPPTVEIRFQSPKPLGRGKARVLIKIVQ
jgi:hypothetical protein